VFEAEKLREESENETKILLFALCGYPAHFAGNGGKLQY
jgi:hypothetical protein